jgi:tetratricopeptide (TPR) repeat protein
MTLDKRAAVIAAAAVAAGVVLGYWSGALAGVLITLAALIPAAVLQVAMTRQGSVSAQVARLAAARGAFAPPMVTAAATDPDGAAGNRGGVSQYLRPELEAVRFWPRPELEELVSWVIADGRVAVRLVTGAGGSGKTRLARRLGEAVTEMGWQPWWVTAGQEADALRVAGESSVPVLLVADYAETRAALPAMLAAAADTDGPSLRVLLLARSAGEWWQRLLDGLPDNVGDLAARHPPLVLGPVASHSDRDELFAEALIAFAELRGVACPEASPARLDSNAVVLVIHAAALLAVLDAEAGAGAVTAAGEDVLGGVLRHERRYWQQSLASRVPGGLDPDVIDRVVTAGCLIGADDQEAAMRLLAVIPDLAGDTRLRGTIARWLRDLYPGPDGPGGREWLGQLQPDLLTERLAVTVLGAHPALTPSLFTDLGHDRAVRALTILAQAALTQPAALSQIQQALQADPSHLLVPAIAVASATNPALADLIVSALADLIVSMTLDTALAADELIAIAEAIPYPSVALAAMAVAVTRQIVNALPPDADPADRARSLAALGTALTQLGRLTDALPVTQEAVAMYRELAEASPDRHRPHLAHALESLGLQLSELGHPADALPVTQEAVAMYRELAEASPDRHRPHLGHALDNLGVKFWELGRLTDALPVTQEAVAIYRELAEASPDRHRPPLARALDNLGVQLSALGRRADALPVTQEAVAMYRKLAEASPDRHRFHLAFALDNLGVSFWELGRPADALPVTQEAAAIFLELAEASPGPHYFHLARALDNLGVELSELGRRADALPLTQEAVAMYRELAEASPARHRPHLANALSNLGVRFLELGRAAEALPVTQEAVAICRELAEASPDRHRPDLAHALDNLGVQLSALGRQADALPVTQEAVAMYLELAEASPDRHRFHLASALSNLGASFLEMGRASDALSVAQEAAAIFLELAEASPDHHRHHIDRTRTLMTAILRALRQTSEAGQIRPDTSAGQE